MIDLERAMKSERLMKALTGQSVTEFQELAPRLAEGLSKAGAKQKRQRAAGGGRKHTLKSVEYKLFFILFYLKCYPTYDLAGILFGVAGSQAYRWVQALLPVLEQVLGWQGVLPQRQLKSVTEFMAAVPGARDIWVDGTERPIQRPQQAKAQQQCYSGKQGGHTFKNLILSTESRQIVFLSYTKPGGRHDYHRFKQAGLGGVIPPEVALWADLGFVGLQNDFPQLDVLLPHKGSKLHPLTPAQKADNRLISACRIRVEHALAGVKRFRALTDTYRNKGRCLADTFILLACGLWNFHLRYA